MAESNGSSDRGKSAPEIQPVPRSLPQRDDSRRVILPGLRRLHSVFANLARRRLAGISDRSNRTTAPAQFRWCVGVLILMIAWQAWTPHSLTAQPGATRGTRTAERGDGKRSTAGVNRPAAAPPRQIDDRTSRRQGINQQHFANQQPEPVDIEPEEMPAEPVPAAPATNPFGPGVSLPGVEQYVSPQGLASSLNVWLVVTVLSLAPAILMMSTCFVRFIVVLSLLRQALGTQNLPPNQVLMGLSLLLTFMVMAPVWNESYQQGIRPYTESTTDSQRPPLTEVFDNTVRPVRRFMSQQIDLAHNADAVWMFIEYQRPAEGTLEAETWQEPQTYDDVPLTVLLPAYLLSELKTAFLIGFQIYLPFLVIDLVVAAVLMSMGLPMLSPGQVSLPFKLLLFVLIDGWTLTVGMLIESVRAVT